MAEGSFLALALILLDASEDHGTREAAGTCLDELLSSKDAYHFASGSLYSAPLPPSADIEGALIFARSSGHATHLFHKLAEQQPSIRRVREAWDSLPGELFDTPYAKDEFERELIRFGGFHAVVDALSDPNGFDRVRFESHQALGDLPNARSVLEAWLEPIRPPKAKRRLAHSLEEPERQTSEPHRSTRTLSSFQAYENVRRQKAAISDLIKEGQASRAREFIDELVELQVRNGGARFAAMSLCDLAQQAKLAHNYSLQLKLSQRAVDLAPHDGWAWSQLSDAFLLTSQLEASLRALAEAESLGERQFAATGRARILRTQGRLPEALEAYAQATATYPGQVIAWIGRAEVLREMGRFDEALHAYEIAVLEFPEEIAPRCGRAAVLTDLGRLDEALSAYDAALDYLGTDVVALSGRAHVLKLMGRLGEALESYERAIREYPYEVVPHCGHAGVLTEMGRYRDALETFDRCVAKFPNDASSHGGRAKALSEAGRLEEALAAYDLAIESFPNDVWLRNGRANALKKMGRLQEALQAYDQNLARFPYNIVAQSGRADLLRSLGLVEEAVRAYDLIIARGDVSNSARYSKAAVLVAIGRYSEANELLQIDEPRTRQEWIGFHIKGMLLLRSEQFEEAIQQLQKGLDQTPFMKERQYFENALAIAKLRLERFDEAAALVLHGEDPVTDVLRLHVSGALNNLDSAKQTFGRLKRSCPPVLIPLRDELAARYHLVSAKPEHGPEWVFKEECRTLLLLAA